MINLLPDSEKKELIKIEKEKVQIIILSLLNFFFICLLLLFLFLNIYFNSQIQTKEYLINSLEQFKESDQIKEQIDKTNKELTKINEFYKDKIHYSLVLNKIFQALPENAYLDTVSFTGNKINLSGFALLREDLLTLKENLEKDFIQVDFPPVNWTEKENINFFTTFLYEKQ